MKSNISKSNSPMTNYNEILYKVLSAIYLAGTENGLSRRFDAEEMMHRRETFIRGNHISKDAKQAITSLIKELVADAKPEKRTPDYYSDSIDLYSRQCAANSWNKAIDQFEQNLLKVLEEV